MGRVTLHDYMIQTTKSGFRPLGRYLSSVFPNHREVWKLWDGIKESSLEEARKTRIPRGWKKIWSTLASSIRRYWWKLVPHFYSSIMCKFSIHDCRYKLRGNVGCDYLSSLLVKFTWCICIEWYSCKNVCYLVLYASRDLLYSQLCAQ